MSRRLSRKEIKRDEFMETLAGSVQWARDHSRLLLGVAVGLVLAGLSAALTFAWLQQRERQAHEALARALEARSAALATSTADPSDPRQPTFPDAAARRARFRELLQAIREDFSRSNAARIATVYLAQLAAEEGDLATAENLWRDFLEESSNHMLAAEVRVNLMALDRAVGRGEELADRIQRMLDAGDSTLPPDVLWFQLALTLEQLGRRQEAEQAYARIVEEFPQSAFAATARARAGHTESQTVGG